MSGAAFTPRQFAICTFLYLALLLSLTTRDGGFWGRKIEDARMAISRLREGNARCCGFPFHIHVVEFRTDHGQDSVWIP